MRIQILVLSILFAMVCEYHCQPQPLNQTAWDFNTNYELNDTSNNNNDYNYNYNNNNSYDSYSNSNDGYSNSNKGYSNSNKGDSNSKEDYQPSEDRSSRTRKSPDEYGNMNLYFREPSYDGKRKKAKKIRFPVHRFERKRFPKFPPLISFLPWLPIFSDRLTKQTIIYSPTGGVYIIPPVINFYGQRFSIAELIASGYASLVSSGGPPPPAVDVAPLVRPGAVTGPGIPPADPATGGFKGGVRTEFRSLSSPKFPKEFDESGSSGRGRGRGGNSG